MDRKLSGGVVEFPSRTACTRQELRPETTAGQPAYGLTLLFILFIITNADADAAPPPPPPPPPPGEPFPFAPFPFPVVPSTPERPVTDDE